MVFDAGTERDESVRRKDGFLRGNRTSAGTQRAERCTLLPHPPPHPSPEDVTFALQWGNLFSTQERAFAGAQKILGDTTTTPFLLGTDVINPPPPNPLSPRTLATLLLTSLWSDGERWLLRVYIYIYIYCGHLQYFVEKVGFGGAYHVHNIYTPSFLSRWTLKAPPPLVLRPPVLTKPAPSGAATSAPCTSASSWTSSASA